MKRFVATIFCTSLFFLGLGVVVEKTKAKFKSDEKALALIKAARQAIGGDNAIGGVQSLKIVGQTTQTFKINGTDKIEQGETEIALMLPDKLMKTIKIGHDDGSADQKQIVSKQVDVVVVGKDESGKTIVRGEGDGDSDGDGDGVGPGTVKIIVKDGGEPGERVNSSGDGKQFITKDGKTVILRRAEGDGNVEFRTEPDGAPLDPNGKQVFFRTGGHAEDHDNELLRLTLGLLVSAPQGMDVNYTYGGESDVDGTSCNVVVAEFAGSSVKLFLNRDSNLPVMMSYSGMRMPREFTFKKEAAPPADGSKDVFYFKKAGEPGGEKADFQVRFSDYRSVNGVQLPYRWTTNVNGALNETFEVSNYEVNPANIAKKFQNTHVILRTKKPDGQ